jgi:DUF1680 family protein
MVNGSEPLSDMSASGGTELCAIAERILSSHVQLLVFGDASVADDLETVAYNSLPATLSGDGKGIRYYLMLNQPSCIDSGLLFANNGFGAQITGAICAGPHSGFGCCRSNFHFAWPKFAESMWMKKDGGLAAVAYGDCVVSTPVATISQTGGYPFSDGVRLEFAETSGGEWPLFVRIPGWCGKAAVKVNDVPFDGSVSSGTFLRIARKWKKGDVVSLSFPSEPAVSFWKDNSLAVTRGPLLYALKIEAHEKIVNAESSRLAKRDANGVLRDKELGFPVKELRAASPWNYALVLETNGKHAFEVKGEGLERRLSVRAVRTGYAGWGQMSPCAPARAEDPPPSPLPATAVCGRVETIDLVPIALTQLRITLFPWR